MISWVGRLRTGFCSVFTECPRQRLDNVCLYSFTAVKSVCDPVWLCDSTTLHCFPLPCSWYTVYTPGFLAYKWHDPWLKRRKLLLKLLNPRAGGISYRWAGQVGWSACPAGWPPCSSTARSPSWSGQRLSACACSPPAAQCIMQGYTSQ